MPWSAGCLPSSGRCVFGFFGVDCRVRVWKTSTYALFGNGTAHEVMGLHQTAIQFICAACKLLPLAAYPHLTDLPMGPTKVSCAGAVNCSTADKQ